MQLICSTKKKLREKIAINCSDSGYKSSSTSDCNPGIEFSIPGSGIEKFVIPGFRFGIRLTAWSLFLVSIVDLFHA